MMVRVIARRHCRIPSTPKDNIPVIRLSELLLASAAEKENARLNKSKGRLEARSDCGSDTQELAEYEPSYDAATRRCLYDALSVTSTTSVALSSSELSDVSPASPSPRLKRRLSAT